jgi:alpha-tubulin suppressor-like RCC1 family protein
VYTSGQNRSLEFGDARAGSLVYEFQVAVILTELCRGKLPHSFALGQKHGLMLNGDGEVIVWGDNKYGQLGFANEVSENRKGAVNCYEGKKLILDILRSEERAHKISCGWNHTVIMTDKGRVYMTGRGDFGQQGNGLRNHVFGFCEVQLLLGGRVKDVVSGSEHVIAYCEDGSVWGWGWNEHGNVGVKEFNNGEDVLRPTLIDLDYSRIDSNEELQEIVCGGGISFICLRDK